MTLIDCHGHLNLEPLVSKWETILERSQARGVVAIVVPGTNLATSHQALKLARSRPGVLFAGLGVHPTSIGEETGEAIDYGVFGQLAQAPEVVAIGEVGFDSYRVAGHPASVNFQDALSRQEKVLRQFISIAQSAQKPLILHCRGMKNPTVRPLTADFQSPDHDPHERLIEILAEINPRPRFIVHCYQGTAAQAERYLRLGGFISFTGSITYSDAAVVRDAVAAVPLDRLMVETDSPFLSPVPYRGQTNEPWKVVEVVRRIAELKGRPVEEIATQTTANAIAFFGLRLAA